MKKHTDNFYTLLGTWVTSPELTDNIRTYDNLSNGGTCSVDKIWRPRGSYIKNKVWL